MAGDEHLRLFLALPLPDDALRRLAGWQARELSRSDVRVVPAGNLHVTLAFLGRRPSADVSPIAGTMVAEAARAERPLNLVARGYRETRSAGMVVLDDEGGSAARLAAGLARGLEELGVFRREKRPWLPHVTVARFRSRPRLDPSIPDLGWVSPSEVALYHSVLRPSGAQYLKIESVALGG